MAEKPDPDHPPWRVLASRIIVSDQWLTMRAETCETASGVLLDPYYLVSGPDVVGMVVITRDEHLVLVRQYRHGFGGVTLELPAGALDPGEDPCTAGLRELVEETGYVASSARLLRTFAYHTERFTNRFHAVLVEGAAPTGRTSHDPTERIETVLWPLAHAQELLLEPSFANPAFAGILSLGLNMRQPSAAASIP